QPQMSRMTTDRFQTWIHLRPSAPSVVQTVFVSSPLSRLQPDISTKSVELPPDEIYLRIRQRCFPVAFDYAG
ncbi:MAG: hypothetical protein WA771_03185, partial [Chthoniobacterales bacterium]